MGAILQDGNWITLSTDRQTAGVSRVTFNTMTHKLADRLKKKNIIQHLEITCNITNWTEGGTLLKSWSHVKRKVVWHFSKLRTLVRSHRNTSVSYREIFFKQISKEYIYLFYPWVFTRLFHTSLNSAHMALKPNYKEYLKTEPRFFFPPCHNIYTRHSAQTGCAENRILFRAFTVLYIYSAAHVIHQAIPF